MARADHIFVTRLRGVYTHHGIDCGDGSVIHYTGESWTTPRSVQRTPMAKFTRGGTVEVRDYRVFFERLRQPDELPRRLQIRIRRELLRIFGNDSTVDEFEPDAVLARAESRLGESGFDIALRNCEHFSTWCKTGISDSEQVHALWRSLLDPRTYWRMRGQGLLTGVFESGGRIASHEE